MVTTQWRRWGSWLKGTMPRWLSAGRPFGAAFLGYLILTILVTYPTAFVFSSRQAGDGADSLVHMWILWWTKTALFDLHVHPNQLALLYYPHQVQQPLLFATPLIQLLALPFSFFLDPWEVYNFFLLASFVLAGMSAFLLCYHITAAPLPSFIGGVIFAFSPHIMAHAPGHLVQIITFPFPLYVLALLRWMERPCWKRTFVLGIALGIALQVHVIFDAYLVFPLSLVFLLYYFLRERPAFWRTLLYLLVAGGIALVLWLPFLWPLLKGYSAGWLQYEQGQEGELLGGSADLLSFFFPVHAPLLRQDQPLGMIQGSSIKLYAEQWAYLGLIPLIWAGYGWRKMRRQAIPWLVVAAVALVLCLGPVLQVGGKPVTVTLRGQERQIPLPYLLLQQLPFLRMGRTPGRAAVTLMLALAVLSCLGAAALPKHWGRWRYALLLVAIPGILFEYWTYWPFPTVDMRIPEFYQQIAVDQESYALLDYPIYQFQLGQNPIHYPNYALLYQTVHHRPIVGGHVWRTPPEESVWLWEMEQYIRGKEVVSLPQMNLRLLGIRYVVLHKFGPVMHVEEITSLPSLTALLQERLGTPVYEDDLIIVFETFEPAGPYVEIGENWYPLGAWEGTPIRCDPWEEEVWYAHTASGLAADCAPNPPLGFGEWKAHLPVLLKVDEGKDDPGAPHRWMTNDAVLQVYVPEEMYLNFSFVATSFHKSRHVDLIVNGQPAGPNWEVLPGPYQTFVSAPVLFQAGPNRVVWHVQEGCDRPSDLGIGADTHCLSLNFAQIHLHQIPSPILLLGENWHSAGLIAGLNDQWMSNDAVLQLFAPRDGWYRLTFSAHTFHRDRHLQLSLDDTVIGQYTIQLTQDLVSEPFFLNQGLSEMVLHVQEGCEVPEVLGIGDDPRCLSVHAGDLQFTEVEEESP